MTATDELRRLLDERRVEWRADDGKTVWVTRWVFDGHSSAMFSEYDDGECVFVTSGHSWTPEQAVAATLGTGTCRIDVFDNLMESEGAGDVWLECSSCHWKMDYAEAPSMPLNYCPNCGRKVE